MRIHNYGGTNVFYKVALDDGATVFFYGRITDNNILYVDVYYDINGIKEPNQLSKDTFIFLIRKDKVLPSGVPSASPFNTYCKLEPGNGGYGCTAWVIYKGNMDYLHCDLTWDKHSCKDK